MRKIEKKHALVIGGGISGLLAARVLVDHFEQVSIIERDHYPKDAVFRPGVPQGRQVHTFLLRGQEILNTMFPKLQVHLFEQGALQHDYGAASTYYYGGRCEVPAHLHGWSCSRLLVEWQVRQELLETYPQIHFIEGYEVTNLLYDADTSSVTGVQYRKRTVSPELEKLHAHLVIDASGFSSQAPRWLNELGFSAPAETLVDASLGYASRVYCRSSVESSDLIAIQATGTSTRGGVLIAMEGGKWIVVLAGTHDDYPPQKDDDYLAFAKSLPNQMLYDAIKDANPVTAIYGYRYPASRRRHYERLKRFPKNFLVLGDAVCSFNPLYGQGMTVAALEARVLDAYLCKKTHGHTTRHFQRTLARITNIPWLLATISNLESTSTTYGLARQYVEQLITILPENPQIFLTFLKVIHMLNSPIVLLRPSILLKVVCSKATDVVACPNRRILSRFLVFHRSLTS